MNYVEGFVVAVKTKDKELYLKHAQMSGPVFKEYGALNIVECWGDDVPEGEVTSFPLAVKCEPDETVVFSWITWPSKKVRDEGMQKAMADERFDMEKNPVPFDGKRMIFGGFQTILEL